MSQDLTSIDREGVELLEVQGEKEAIGGDRSSQETGPDHGDEEVFTALILQVDIRVAGAEVNHGKALVLAGI